MMLLFVACLVCSEAMQNKSIRYTSVQTVQPSASEAAAGQMEKLSTQLVQPDHLVSTSQLTEEKLLEHENVNKMLTSVGLLSDKSCMIE